MKQRKEQKPQRLRFRCDFCGRTAKTVNQPDGWRMCEKCILTRRMILKELLKHE